MEESDAPKQEAEAPKRWVITVQTRWLRVAAVVVVAATVAAVAVVVSHGAAAAVPSAGCGGGGPTITEQGQASASGTPHTLNFEADINVNAASAAAALSQDNSVTAAVVAALEAQGVAKKDIATTNLSVSPNYSYIHGQSVISGYGVDNSLSVTIKHVQSAGTVIDAAASAGETRSASTRCNSCCRTPRRFRTRRGARPSRRRSATPVPWPPPPGCASGRSAG